LEVLLFVDPVDDFWTSVIQEYKEVSTEGNKRFMKSQKPVVDGFIDTQFSIPNAEDKYKESKKGFYISAGKDVAGLIATGLLTACTAVCAHKELVAGAVILGILAVCTAIGTGWHITNSKVPRYREMQENKVEHISAMNRA